MFLLFTFSLVQTKQTKLKVLKGSTHHISDHKLAVGGDRLAGSIKLFCCVAVSPHLRLSKGKKIPADRVCHSLHVSFQLAFRIISLLSIARGLVPLNVQS